MSTLTSSLVRVKVKRRHALLGATAAIVVVASGSVAYAVASPETDSHPAIVHVPILPLPRQETPRPDAPTEKPVAPRLDTPPATSPIAPIPLALTGVADVRIITRVLGVRARWSRPSGARACWTAVRA